MRSLSEPVRPGRRWSGALAAALTVLLAAGCATMPDSGDPEAVAPPQGAGADQGIQVRVLPFPPRDGLNPAEVLQNFLDASIADEANYKTAKQYLTGDALTSWQPDSGAVVLKSTAQQKPPVDDDSTATDQVVLTISSHQIGQLDAQHTYRATDQQYTGTFTLVNTAKDAKDTKDPKEAAARAEWRISQLPTGLVLDQVSFRNAYQQVDRYYFTKDDPQAPGPDQDPVLVPDPIYLRRRVDPDSAAARALAEGPSQWLAPAVHSAFDDSVHPADTVTSDDPHNPKLRLDGVDCVVSERQCRQIAAQLYFTLVSVNGPTAIESVTVTGRRGSASMNSTQAKNSSYQPGNLAGTGLAYVRDADNGQLARLPLGDSPGQSNPVPGVLGAAKLPPALQPSGGKVNGQYAVRRDDKAAAVVSEDGKSLYVAGLDDTAKSLGAPLATSRAPRPDQGLSSPSWDGYDDLFVVDRDPAAPQVLMLRNQAKVTVPVAGLADGQTVDGLRVSSDGTRVALLLSDGGGHTLAIGLVQRGGTPTQPTAEITAVRQVSPPQLADVTSVSWADPDTLLVLGKEADSVMQLHYLSTDGSTAIDTNGLQAVDGMSVVAASESRSDPVLADAKDTDHTVYRLFGTVQPQWKVAAKDGGQPAYAG
ncbi:LpqB family beta-propeller domain-containing protein [Kitasatospora viridis]|uniref:Lipoprotein LpqB-like beta-propeller protein n=1 Tax=Kitasatospora viridis TaxID=281105 RepID=A0A561UK48_9ACTN|nr:LpqB family beta-propeller domain-containing protein [Kitasatospora viridis]TWF99727.1 lipoprotein LpqB-like beta-propeller protein [Kitasatospora viridis]